MLISFLMPVYNKEPWLAEAIESVLGQTHKDIELVIINDNSKDGSLDVAEFYAKKDKRVKVYSNVKNIGVADSRNRARQFATGKIFCVADGDDLSVKTRAEVAIAFFKKRKDADIMYGNAKVVGEGNYDLGDRKARDLSLSQLKRENHITHSTVSFRDAAPTYREGLRYIDDWYFYLDAALSGSKFGFVDNILSIHRITPDGLTQKGGFMTKSKERLRKNLTDEFSGIDDDLTDKMERPIQVIRKKALLKAVKSACKKGKVLDVGCNGGYMIKALNSKGYTASGVDIATNLVRKCIADGLNVKRKSLFTPFDDIYDIGLACDVLEHYHRDDVKKAVTNLLKSCKKLIISVPYKHGIYASERYADHVEDYTVGDFITMLPDRKVTSVPVFLEGDAVPIWELITIS